jgi:DNA-binding NarL/FixJ family response regulator
MPGAAILLIDNHAMFRAGLSMVVTKAMPEVAIFQAASVDEAISTTTGDIQAVLLDIKLNGSSGLEGLALVRQKWPKAPVLMLSSQDDPETSRLALARGAAAFVSKAETGDRIVRVIQQLLQGDFSQARPGMLDSNRKLTLRQREVLALLHLGLSNKLIARKLELSDNTVRRHVQDILEYFQVANRAEAVFAARQQALVG